MSLIPPDFLTEAEAFYQSHKTEKQIAIPEAFADLILQEAPLAYEGSLSVLHEEGRSKKIAFLLSLFVVKRPDVGYLSGMNSILAVALSVLPREIHAFCLFCHLIENVFPSVISIKDYFKADNRYLVQHTEFRIFAMMAEHLRPLIVNSLRVRASTSSDHDHSAFILMIKRVGQAWFNTLFSHMLVPNELLRVWDNILVYEIEFIHKFALVVLSKNEKFIRNSVKAEAKANAGALQIDALIAAGNAVKQKLLAKIETSAVEGLIKKALTKPSYVALTRQQFLVFAKREENSYIERLRRLQQTKDQLRRTNTDMDLDSIVTAFESLEDIETHGLVSKIAFIQVATNIFRWSYADSLRFFTAFDQKGDNQVDVRELKAALAVLMRGSLQDKLRACFMAFDIDGSGDLDPEEVIEMVSIIERCLDGRSSFFKPNSESLYTSMGRNAEGKIPEDAFVAAAESNPTCRPVLDFIQAIEMPISTDVNVDLSQIQAASPRPKTPTSPIPEESFSKVTERLMGPIEELKEKRRKSVRIQGSSISTSVTSRHLHSAQSQGSNPEEQRQKTPEEKQRQACGRLCTRDMCVVT